MRFLIPLVLLFQTPPEPGWPQFRGNPALTGVATTAMPDTLKLLWTAELGESIESSAAISDGKVFVGSMPGELSALDLTNGEVLWKYKVSEDGLGESSPAVHAGVVYVGDLAGVLHAVSARDGKPLWTFKTGSEIKSSPVVVDGKVLIGSYDEHLYALTATKGELLWKLRAAGPVHSTAGISRRAGGTAYVAGCDAILRGVRVSDGKELSQIPSGAYTGASPALDGNRAFYGTFNNEVLAVDLVSGKVVWRYEHPERHFPFYASAAVAEGRVVVGGRDKLVHCLDARTGKAHWTFATGARVESSAAIAGGKVYVGSNDGKLYVLDLHTGEKRWEFNAGAPISASPALAAGRLVIGAQDGRLYCLGGS